MNARWATRALVALLAIVIVVAVAIGAYDAGYSAAGAGAAVAPATVPYPWVWGPGMHFGLGWGFFGFLFPLLFFVFFFLLIRAAFWGAGPRRHGPWHDDRGMGWREGDFETWHRQMHDEAARGAGDRPTDAGRGGA